MQQCKDNVKTLSSSPSKLILVIKGLPPNLILLKMKFKKNDVMNMLAMLMPYIIGEKQVVKLFKSNYDRRFNLLYQ